MALKKEKLASGGEVGEVPKKPSFKDKHLKNKKRIIFIGIFLIVLISLSFIIFQKDTQKTAKRCNIDLYKDASSYLKYDQVNSLKPIAKRIEKEPGYTDDPNCLIPVLYYYVNTGNVDKSQEAYIQLQNSYDNFSLSETYKNKIGSLNDIGVLVEGVKLRDQEFKESKITF